MRTTLPLTLLFMLGCLITGTQIFAASPVSIFSDGQALPDLSSVCNDLDARDAHNRPVTSAARRTELRALFQSSLFSLLLSPELPSIAKALDGLRRLLALADRAITRPLPALRSVIAALGAQLRRFGNAAFASFNTVRALLLMFLLVSPALFTRVYPAAQTSPVFRC
jgi:hypothetical protein